ncbi:MAG: N-acetylmuramoyl-L-alanine amidase [Actinobacteria bacterium]|nr:MAG: N-acetylmuramoyl-L-alanine amidase [Actinomycetota bacterium]
MTTTQTVALGDTGPVVAEVRSRLVLLGHLPKGAGGSDFDDDVDRAVRAFQQSRGLVVDGLVGADTFRRLEEARWQLGDRVLWFSAAHPHAGDDVLELQKRLKQLGFFRGRVVGIFGRETDAALREFQQEYGIIADGTCGLNTVVALRRIEPSFEGGMPDHLWDEHAHSTSLTGIADKLIVVDPAHGGPELGDAGYGLMEAYVADDLARRIEGRLAAIGTQVLLTRPPSDAATEYVSEARRAALANRVNADLVISLHTDSAPSARPHGVATYYFGNGREHSVLGKRFAELVQDEVTRRTGLLDCRSHSKTWDLLRLTRMPTVRIEVGYLSHAGDAAWLHQRRFRNELAAAIAAASVAFYSPATLTRG